MDIVIQPLQLQTQQPQEVVSLKRFTIKRSVILGDYIVFLLEHEDSIGLMKNDSINVRQAMQS